MIVPIIHRQAGFTFKIWPNDHKPAHVHVYRAGAEVRIDIGSDKVRPSVLSAEGMSAKDGRQALEIVAENQAAFLAQWRKLHG